VTLLLGIDYNPATASIGYIETRTKKYVSCLDLVVCYECSDPRTRVTIGLTFRESILLFERVGMDDAERIDNRSRRLVVFQYRG